MPRISPTLISPSTARLLDRLGGRPRQIAAGICAVLAVLAALSAKDARAEPTSAVVVAARDVAAGATLGADDLRTAQWPRSAVPKQALTSAQAAIGHRVGAPMSSGEPITHTRLADGGYGDMVRPGMVAVVVELGTQTAMLRAGDLVDVYASDSTYGSLSEVADRSAPTTTVPPPSAARRVAAGATVLATLPGSTGSDRSSAVLEVDPSTAATLALLGGATLSVAVIKTD